MLFLLENVFGEYQGDIGCRTGITNGRICSSEGCGLCGGGGCQDRPGGPLQSCIHDIYRAKKLCENSFPPCLLPVASAPRGDSTCKSGIISNYVCCLKSCGYCGGFGCEKRRGGANNCCTDVIKKLDDRAKLHFLRV